MGRDDFLLNAVVLVKSKFGCHLPWSQLTPAVCIPNLRKMGVGKAVQDYGVGLDTPGLKSSLSHLAHFTRVRRGGRHHQRDKGQLVRSDLSK